MPELVSIGQEPMILEHAKPIYFQCRRGDYCPFQFNVTAPCVINLRTWPLDDHSDPDLYVGIDSDQVDENTYLFKSNMIGADQVTVYPDDPKFRIGLWKVVIHAFNNGDEQKLGIKLSIKEAKPITKLHKEMAPIEATVSDSVYFQYTIEDTSDLEQMLLMLNISKRKDLQVYIHRAAYPSHVFNDHEYALGDVPSHALKAIYQNYYMKEMYHDANPFQYDREIDQVLYHPNFSHTNQDCFDPTNRDKLDSHRIAQYTTWSPDSGPELNFVTPYRL